MSERNWQKREEIHTLCYQMNNLFDELINQSISKPVNIDNATREPAIEPKDLDIHVTKDTVSITG